MASQDKKAIAIRKMSDISMILGHAICVAQSLLNKSRLFPEEWEQKLHAGSLAKDL